MTYLKHRITNATAEGFNSKIQSIKSAARGFRNFENHRLSILFHCGKLNLTHRTPRRTLLCIIKSLSIQTFCRFVYFTGFPLSRLCKNSTLGRVTCGKPFRVWLFYWIPAFETVQETLVRLRWWKTQPPKSPLSGGLSTQFPPDKGG